MNILCVSTQISAMHHWDGAPELKEYLKVSHRHDFHVLARIPVETDDREYELHDLHDELDDVLLLLAGVGRDFGGMSCEQIGKEVLKRFSKAATVSVWEDQNHGAESHREAESKTKRIIVTVCGSTKFKKETLEAIKCLEDSGCIALSVGSFMHADDLNVSDVRKDAYDRLHFDKISISDSIMVVNPGGYIGDSTREEIKFARGLGLRIDYTFDPVSCEVRSEVEKFAQVMEEKLCKNDHKGGWEDVDSFELLRLLLKEKDELFDALRDTPFNPKDVIKECADVANFAMMIANNTERKFCDE